MRHRPDLFIIGASKCGTTSVWKWLQGHPQVFMAPRKEPRFFAPDLMSGVAGKNLRYPEDMDRYLALFEGARDEKRLGEGTPRYIYSREAPGLIHEFNPNAFIVAMLRNPIDMMHSLHAHRVAGGSEPITDFEQALAAEEARRQGLGVRPEGNPLLTLYRDRARFGEQLPRWFDTFGPERVHVIVLEDMVRDPAATFRRLLEFLQIDPDYRPDTFTAYNPRHQPRSMLLRSVLTSRLPQLLMWRVLPGVLGERRARGALKPLRRMNRTPARRLPVDPELRLRLQREFSTDVAVLSRLLGRDMAGLWWTQRNEALDEERHKKAAGIGAPS